MTMARKPTPQSPQDTQRRRNVVRTALVFGVIALGIYIAFIASGVLRAG